MPLNLRTLFLPTALAATLCITASAHAAVITWSSQTDSSNSTAFMTLPGEAAIADFNIGGTFTTYGGETWAETTDLGGVYNNAGTIKIAYSKPNVYWANAAPVFDPVGGTALLNDAGWASGYLQLDVQGLTVGQTYTLQFIAADSRPIYGVGDYFEIEDLATSSASAPLQYGYADGSFGIISATFTANNANMSFDTLQGSNSSVATGANSTPSASSNPSPNPPRSDSLSWVPQHP